MAQQIEEIKIAIENCNSIDLADISLQKGRLNIKFGPNGIGKSTIAKAMVSQIRGDGTLDVLIPFKRRGKDTETKPKVDGASSLKSALVFDEDYVNQFVFQQDEVVKNSFAIFIKTTEYLASMQEIEQLLDREGFGNSDSVISGSLASPTPPEGGDTKERGNETHETESRSHL